MSGNLAPLPYVPTILAYGVTTDAPFIPAELWAGESPIITDVGPASVSMAQFTVVARNASDFTIVPWNPVAADGEGVGYASGTFTFSAAPAANDTITITGTAVTFIAVGTTPVGNQVIVGVDGPTTVQNLLTFLEDNASTFPLVNATGATNVLTIDANTPGTAGNALTIAKSSSAITVSGSTLAGGTVDSARPLIQGKPIGFLLAACTAGQFCQMCTGGSPNHEMLIWPAAINTIAARKAAFDGTAIHPSKLYG